MTRFHPITHGLMLVTASVALATSAGAHTVQDVQDALGSSVDPSHPLDLNCDGGIGVADVLIAGQVVQAQSAPGFDPTGSVYAHFGTTLAEQGEAFAHEADLNGDCAVGVPDLEVPDTLNALSTATSPDLLQALNDDWGTKGDSVADLNCDGGVGVADVGLVAQAVNAQHAPHFDKLTAVYQAYGTRAGDPGYHPAADDGDCGIGFKDLLGAIQENAAEQ